VVCDTLVVGRRIKHLAKKERTCKAKGSGCAINDFAYNIGTGNATSVNQLFTILQDIIGFPGEPLYGPARPGELQRSYLNADRARAKLGWEPRVDITFGLTATAKYLAEHRK
jgi:UDP-glucose 4-epimerase